MRNVPKYVYTKPPTYNTSPIVQCKQLSNTLPADTSIFYLKRIKYDIMYNGTAIDCKDLGKILKANSYRL